MLLEQLYFDCDISHEVKRETFRMWTHVSGQQFRILELLFSDYPDTPTTATLSDSSTCKQVPPLP